MLRLGGGKREREEREKKRGRAFLCLFCKKNAFNSRRSEAVRSLALFANGVVDVVPAPFLAR